MKNKIVLLCVLSGFAEMFASAEVAAPVKVLTPGQQVKLRAEVDRDVLLVRCLSLYGHKDRFRREGTSDNSNKAIAVILAQDAEVDCSSVKALVAAYLALEQAQATLEAEDARLPELACALGVTIEEADEMLTVQAQARVAAHEATMRSYLHAAGVDVEKFFDRSPTKK